MALLCCAVRVEATLEPQADVLSVRRRRRAGRYYAIDQLACEQQLLGDGKEWRVELDEDKYAEVTSADSGLLLSSASDVFACAQSSHPDTPTAP